MAHNGLYMMSCVFHPLEKAMSWIGHVHIMGLASSVTVLAGHCRICEKSEEHYGPLINDINCQGCYGLLEGMR